MHKLRRIPLLIAAVCFGVLVLFLLLPRIPSTSNSNQMMGSNEHSGPTTSDPDSLKLMEAINLVEGNQDPMKGIIMLRELVTKDSNNVDAQFYLGVFSVRSGQLDKAIGRFERVLAIRPNDPLYVVNVGYQYLGMGDINRALPCFEHGIELDSTNINALFFSAQCYEHQSKFALAKNNYEALLRHTDDSLVVSKVTQIIDSLNIKLNP